MAETEKKKETPWTEQKLMYKDGNVDAYRYFNWETWKRMTVDERAMWTEASMATPASISKEVIDFNKKIADKADKIVKPKATFSVDPKLATGGVLDIIEAEKEELKAKLKERGIRFTHNSKLETLKKKLADADNPE